MSNKPTTKNDYAKTAMDTLISIITDHDMQPECRIKACDTLLSYTWSYETEVVDNTATTTD